MGTEALLAATPYQPVSIWPYRTRPGAFEGEECLGGCEERTLLDTAYPLCDNCVESHARNPCCDPPCHWDEAFAARYAQICARQDAL